MRAPLYCFVVAILAASGSAIASDGEEFKCDVFRFDPIMKTPVEGGSFNLYAPVPGVSFKAKVNAVELLRVTGEKSVLGNNLGTAALLKDGVAIRSLDRAQWTTLAELNDGNLTEVHGYFSGDKSETEFGFVIDPIEGNGVLTLGKNTKYRLRNCKLTPVQDLPTLEFVPDESK